MEGAVCAGFINAMPVQIEIPFVTRAFGGESTLFIERAFEDRSAVCVRAGGSANVTRQEIADARQWIFEINWLRREDLGARQLLVVILGVKTGGNSQLPKIVHASRVMGFG